MNIKRLALFIGFTLIICLGFYRPWLNDKQIAERAHGFHLPESAESVQTVGDWRMFLPDKGASTAFIMSAEELNAFLAYLSNNKSYGPAGFTPRTGIPGNDRYHHELNKYWDAGMQPVNSYGFKTKSGILSWIKMGDWLHINVYEYSADKIAMHLYTDWN